MTILFLVAALLGCHNPNPDNTDSVGINPGDDTATNPDDTGVNPSKVGFLDATAVVLDNPEACRANVFDQAHESAGIDYTGDDELLSLDPGPYTVAFGLTAAELYPDDEDFADAVNDVVDDLHMHEDGEGNLWAGIEQGFEITAETTTPVAGDLSMIPAFCPFDEDGCNGQDDEVGQWSCEIDGEVYQDYVEVNQFRDESILSVYVPCFGDMILEDDSMYFEDENGRVDGTYINAGWIEVRGSYTIDLWVGREGDDPR